MAIVVTQKHNYGSNGYNCLHAACRNGHVEVVRYLIEVCLMDPCVPTSKRECTSETNALHVASQYGHESVVKYLIEKGKIDPNSPDENSNLAVIYKQFKVVHFLTDSNSCDPYVIPQSMLDQVKDSRICEQLTPIITPPLLHLVTSRGDLNILKRQTKKALQSCTHSFDRRLIHVAAEFGHLHIIKFFVEQNIFKPDLKDENKFTPALLAAGKGYVNIFKYLVQECKCDPNCKSSDDYDEFIGGGTPLHYAALHGHLSMVQHILESNYGIDADVASNTCVTPLQCAAMKGHLDIVRYLTKRHNCNASHRNEEDTNALHLSTRNDHLNVVRYLIEEMKCDPAEYTGILGRSTIHIAANTGSLEIINYLISECGIDPNMQSTIAGFLETPLHCAAYQGNLHIVKYLTRLPDCDIHCRTIQQFTPLHMAAEQGHIEVVKHLSQLYENGQLQRDLFGNVPLHFASYFGHFEMVKFLCKEMGTSPAIKNHHNQTPLHVALQMGHGIVALYLIVLLYFECQDSGF